MERRSIIRPKLLQQYPKGSPQRETGVELLKSNVLQLEDRAHQLLKLIRLRLGKDLQQDASEHCERVLHRSARICTDFVTPDLEWEKLVSSSILGGRHTVRHTHPRGAESSISDFTTSMTRFTVEDSTAGLGQTIRTGRPLAVGSSDHDVSGLCMSSWARRMPEVLAVGRSCGRSVDSTARNSRQCEHELELRDGVENRMLPSEEKQQSEPR